MGCMNTPQSEQQRSASADKTSEEQGQEENHSATDIHALTSDDEFVQALDDKREKLSLPPENAKKLWEELDQQIVAKLDTLLGESTLEHKLATYGDVVYATCRDIHGTQKPKEKKLPKKSRRQPKMENIRIQKKNLKKRLKTAPDAEAPGLRKLWEDLKT